MEPKIKVKKGTVEETLLLPLWGRAYETQKKNPRIIDKKALEIIGKLDYDFSEIVKTQIMSQHGWVARCLHIDKMALAFIKKHPEATIVNVGCGMDTTFSRVDNGKIMFYELDLPDVIKLRKHFFQDTDRHQCISSSFLDTDYFKQIEVKDGLLFLVGGVFMYFSEDELKTFFIQLADYFKQCDLYFDALSLKALKMSKKQVLKKGGMNTSFGNGWGLKSAKEINNWNERIKLIEAKPMYKGTMKNIPFLHKFFLTITDAMKMGVMVHVRINEEQINGY